MSTRMLRRRECGGHTSLRRTRASREAREGKELEQSLTRRAETVSSATAGERAKGSGLVGVGTSDATNTSIARPPLFLSFFALCLARSSLFYSAVEHSVRANARPTRDSVFSPWRRSNRFEPIHQASVHASCRSTTSNSRETHRLNARRRQAKTGKASAEGRGTLRLSLERSTRGDVTGDKCVRLQSIKSCTDDARCL